MHACTFVRRSCHAPLHPGSSPSRSPPSAATPHGICRHVLREMGGGDARPLGKRTRNPRSFSSELEHVDGWEGGGGGGETPATDFPSPYVLYTRRAYAGEMRHPPTNRSSPPSSTQTRVNVCVRTEERRTSCYYYHLCVRRKRRKDRSDVGGGEDRSMVPPPPWPQGSYCITQLTSVAFANRDCLQERSKKNSVSFCNCKKKSKLWW